MDYSIDYKEIDGKYNLIGVIDGEDLNLEMPLSHMGDAELLSADINDFVDDAMDGDVTTLSIQLSGEENPLGIIVDIYKGEDDDDPISVTYWFDDYSTEEDND